MYLAMPIKKLVQLCQLNSTIHMSNSSDIQTHVEMRAQGTTKALKDCITQWEPSPAVCPYTAGAPSVPDVSQLCPGGISAVRGTKRSSPQSVSAPKHRAAVPLHPWMWLKFARKYEQNSCSFFGWICGRFIFCSWEVRPARDCDEPATASGFYSHQSWCWAFPPVWHITKTC